MVKFNALIQAQFNKMCATGKLFRSSIQGHQIWDLYLSSFTNEQNPIFRDPESSTFNCNLCNNFIRRYGNIVAIDDDYNVITMFDVKAPDEFKNACKVISKALKLSTVSEVFFETYQELQHLPYESINKIQPKYQLGVAKNVKRYTREESEKFGVVKPNEIREFQHLHLSLPTQFVDKSGKSIEAIMGDYRDAKNVFHRAMMEIPVDTIKLVIDLIKQGSLLDGQTHLYKLEQILPYAIEFSNLPAGDRNNWCWIKSFQLPYAKFKNELIGVLCTELAEGKELNEACKAWNKRVDPANYMKATAPITQRQIEEAKKFVEENGYEESFNRRYATIDDIKTSEILHVNVGKGEIKSVSIFDNVKSTSTRHKRSEFDNVEEVSIEKFMQDILPECTSVEAYLTSKHEGNMVSLTTANVKDSKPIFKWDNNYSWTFNGNLAGKSQIKEAVKSRGGNVTGDIRISLSFPNTTDDYDLHVRDSHKNHIYYSNVRFQHNSSGILDLDAQGVDGHQPPEKRVENIVFTDKSKILNGEILIWVENYSRRGIRVPFDIEIEIEGNLMTFTYNKSHSGNSAGVGAIKVKNGTFEFIPTFGLVAKENTWVSKEVYSLQTEQFHKVNLVCLSPNHWGNNNVGNKHYFFMLDNCKSKTSIRSFHAENLIPELAQHRKVLEVLGNTTMLDPADKQLSGLGFNATVKDELIVRLQGSFKRVIKIKF